MHFLIFIVAYLNYPCFLCSAFSIHTSTIAVVQTRTTQYTLLEVTNGEDEVNDANKIVENSESNGENNSHRNKEYQSGRSLEADQQQDDKSRDHQNKDENRKATSTVLSSFRKFLYNEKKRMQNVIEYEQSRMKEIESFFTKEKMRLKKLEQLEKELLSNALIDEAVKRLSSSFSPLLGQEYREYEVGNLALQERGLTDQGWRKFFVPQQQKEARYKDYGNDSDSDSDSDFVYIYQPKASRFSPPSMIICFLGGAGLGQFPHIIYSRFLTAISERLNATIITVPYRIQLNHNELSHQTNDLFERAIASYEEKMNHLWSGYENQEKDERNSYKKGDELNVLTMTNKVRRNEFRVYFLGHSLGSKLLSLSLAELHYEVNESDRNNEKNSDSKNIAGVGFMAYNNFGFRDTTKQIKSFSSALFNKDTEQYVKEGEQTPRQETQRSILGLDSIIEFSEQAMSMTGLEFTPSPSDTYEILTTKYRQQKGLLQKTRLFVFDDDGLDSSETIIQAMDDRMEDISVSGLPGSHLAPVFVNILDMAGDDDVHVNNAYNRISKIINDVAIIDSMQGLYYGDEDCLSSLVEEVCNWILGKDPARGPNGRT